MDPGRRGAGNVQESTGTRPRAATGAISGNRLGILLTAWRQNAKKNKAPTIFSNFYHICCVIPRHERHAALTVEFVDSVEHRRLVRKLSAS